MNKNILLLILLVFSFLGKAQHTFSIVAVDSVTGEIGSAGATCGDSIIWVGTPGAKLISDVIPGKGAIHTQSYHDVTNQANAHTRMLAGDNPQTIITWLVSNDVDGDSTIRQYGVIDYNAGHPRSAAFTGSGCFNYKNHVLGPNYAIQGNILLGQKILDSMEARFNRTKGTLADKLMEAMQGAKVVGADTRCTGNGTSSLSAFMRVAKPTDNSSALYLDINIAGTAQGAEPIDKLQAKYNAWKKVVGFSNTPVLDIILSPNPSNGIVQIEMNGFSSNKIEIVGLLGQVLQSKSVASSIVEVDLTKFQSGIYFMNFYKDGLKLGSKKVVKQ
ncbi:MAG: DUF1028 domain-containing protein [Flavobacteriaceae bacterium]|nr:DUF1028 domain-containing protein [Flavobacteriaceae bacterium]